MTIIPLIKFNSCISFFSFPVAGGTNVNKESYAGRKDTNSNLKQVEQGTQEPEHQGELKW